MSEPYSAPTMTAQDCIAQIETRGAVHNTPGESRKISSSVGTRRS
jgi:hypothetical protein